MADALENAALAFDADMGGGKPAASPGGISDAKSAPEPIFGNSDAQEGDLRAGGDDTPAPGEKRVRPKKAAPEEDDDPEGILDERFDPDEEVDPDEEDDEDEDEGKKSDEEDDDEDELLNKEFTVMVDGEEVQVPLKEALDGYIRTKTFHKRLNQLDAVKQQLTAHAQKVVEDRQRYDEMLAEAEETIAGLLPAEPDWDKLFQEDPKAARELQKQYDAYRGKITEIREKRLKAQRDQAQQDAREQAEFARAEFPKFAAYAKWRDKEEMGKDINSMRRTALSAGFSEQETAQVLDSRMLVVLLKASKYDRMMAARPKAVKSGKTPVNPGAGSKSTARRGVIGAQKKLARTGSVEDAADVFAKILNR